MQPKHEWRDTANLHPISHKVTGGVCWRTNGTSGEQGVLMLENKPDLPAGTMLVDVESRCLMSVIRTAENGGLCVITQHSSPLKWWQRIICQVFRICDVRDSPPCVPHGGVVLVLGESHYEGEDVPSAYAKD